MERRKGGCVGRSSRVDIGGYVGFGGQEPGGDPLRLGRAGEKRGWTWWG